MKLGLVCVALVLAGASGSPLSTPPSTEATSWWAHIQVLAADSLRGRLTGTEDYDKAARYVAGKLAEYGARPGGDHPDAAGAAGYFQNVPFVVRKLREPECSVRFERDGVEIPFTLGRNGTLGAAVDFADTLDAELVFVGYGLDVPDAGYSDIKGLDLRGKVAVYVRSGPDTLPPTVRAHAQASDVRWSGLRAAGAVGYISVSPMFRRGGVAGMAAAAAAMAAGFAPPGAGVINRRAPGIALDDASLDPLAGARFSMRVNGGYFDSLLVGTGHTAAELFALNDKSRPLPVFPLNVKLHARVRADIKHVVSPNVAGIIRGSDPRLRDEYVVVSAHLDHLGVGEPVKGDSIYNGAMDNASGVASLVEFARYAKAAKAPFRRSVILLAVTGEEQQLYGSWWYAAHPTVPAPAIVADINLDMFLPIMPLKTITVYGREESDLGERFAAVAARAGVAVDDDHEPQRNYFIRSDQYSFIRKGVPSLFFEIGAGADTVAAAKLAAWNRDNYHKVSDDLNQPVDLEVAAAFTRLLYDFTRDVANAPEAPKWKASSFFKRFALPERREASPARSR